MKLYASISKEFLLLFRDRAGMILLFVMPAFLVVVITLIQDKVTTTTVEVLFIDNDRGVIGNEVHRFLAENEIIRLVSQVDGQDLSAEEARRLVAAGKYQFALVLPALLSEKAEAAAKRSVVNQLFPEREDTFSEKVPEIRVWFDPTVYGSFRSAVSSILAQAIHGVQAQLLVENTFSMLPEKISAGVPPMMKSYLPRENLQARDYLPQLFEDITLIPVVEQFTTEMGFVKQPTAVQQNVPAWAIFGIFFISVPLAGSFIHERQTGTLKRLRVLPVSYFTVMAGKLIAYACICVIQIAVILSAGIYILPLLGVPAFSPGDTPLLAVVLLAAVVAAACGYGILLGTIGRTYEQIAVFAPVSIVIGAAIGGIMVPVYALPELIRPFCYLSPLFWGQSGFYDILLRQSGWPAIMPEVTALLGFCALTSLGSFISSRYR
jgi:ABC-2 type transport system permease protein